MLTPPSASVTPSVGHPTVPMTPKLGKLLKQTLGVPVVFSAATTVSSGRLSASYDTIVSRVPAAVVGAVAPDAGVPVLRAAVWAVQMRFPDGSYPYQLQHSNRAWRSGDAGCFSPGRFRLRHQAE